MTVSVFKMYLGEKKIIYCEFYFKYLDNKKIHKYVYLYNEFKKNYFY